MRKMWQGESEGRYKDATDGGNQTIRIRVKEEEKGQGENRKEEGEERKRGPENGETIQSAADAANCPLIIRSRRDEGWIGKSVGFASHPLDFVE